MSPEEKMQHVDALLTHVWMVRTFIKHSEEVEEDEELHQVVRKLYDYTHALGTAWLNQDADSYLTQARKKLHRLRQATEQFTELQPEVSSHMNFQMAVRSLQLAVKQIEDALAEEERD